MLPKMLLLANVTALAETFALPVVMSEFPPVLKLAWLLPVSAPSVRVLPTVALLLWPTVLLVVPELVAVFVEYAPFPELLVGTGCPLHPAAHPWL